MNVLGVYTITYNVCDAANNCVTLTRTVRVVDKTAPVIVLIGDNPIEINRYSNYQEPGFVVNDNYYAPSSFSVNVNTSEIINHIPGLYYVRYNTIDGSGNAAEEVKRLVRVVNVTTGVDEVINSNGLFVYPNPVENGLVNIYQTKGKIKEIKVTDMLGRLIITNIPDTNPFLLDLSNAGKGIYIIQITNEDGAINTVKVSSR
jgi:hypothetical protein